MPDATDATGIARAEQASLFVILACQGVDFVRREIIPFLFRQRRRGYMLIKPEPVFLKALAIPASEGVGIGAFFEVLPETDVSYEVAIKK
jgi:hypothetical protein